jgi:hypothetical protein
MKKKELYLIQFNFPGLHNFVYTIKPYTKNCSELSKWYDKSGNISANPNQPLIFVRDDITQILFNNKKEAEKTLKILMAYWNHIRTHC